MKAMTAPDMPLRVNVHLSRTAWAPRFHHADKAKLRCVSFRVSDISTGLEPCKNHGFPGKAETEVAAYIQRKGHSTQPSHSWHHTSCCRPATALPCRLGNFRLPQNDVKQTILDIRNDLGPVSTVLRLCRQP